MKFFFSLDHLALDNTYSEVQMELRVRHLTAVLLKNLSFLDYDR